MLPSKRSGLAHGRKSEEVGGNHYKNMPIAPWDVMATALTPEEHRGFLEGNVIK
jgi:hypothetical protein